MTARRVACRLAVAALVVAAAGTAVSAWTVRASGRRHAAYRGRAEQWLALDEDLPDDLSPTELNMLEHNR